MTVPLFPTGLPPEIALLFRATLLLGATWATAAALRKLGASAAARHMTWLLGIVALLVLPVVWFLFPAISLPILPVEVATPGAADAAARSLPSSAAALAESSKLPGYGAGRLAPLAVYLLGAIALLLRLVIGRRMLARLWREADAVRDTDWDKLLSQLSAGMPLSRRVEMRISRGRVMPMTWGTLAPKVLLPSEASSWPLERRRLVLLHELAHVARYDSLSQSVASLACALYWFHPGAWFAARRMHIEQEHAADDRVLTSGGSADAYARSLLHVAQAMGETLHPRLAATMIGTCQLERRLVSITSPARRARPGMGLLSLSALLAAVATLVVAAGVPVSPSASLRSAPASGLSGVAPPMGKLVGSPAPDDGFSSETLAQTVSVVQAQTASGETSVASAGRPGADAPEAVGSATGDPAQRANLTGDASALKSSEQVRSADLRQAPPQALQLPDYGWELPRAQPVQIGSPGTPSPSTRLISPPPIYSEAKERTGRSKWTQFVPRLVPPSSSTPSRSSTSPDTLTLTWSIAAGPQ